MSVLLTEENTTQCEEKLHDLVQSKETVAAWPEGQTLLDSELESAVAHLAVNGERCSKSLCRAQLQDLQPTVIIEDLLRQQLVFWSDERCQVF